jgi:predicted amidophosphoribosyltransferase
MPSIASLVRLVLPRRCVACRSPGEWMCDECGAQMRPLALPQCARCGGPTALPVTACRACARLRFFATARSALWLEGPLRVLMTRWKLGAISPGELAAALVAHEVPRPPVEAIVVVPAVRERLLLRGADPPAELAAALAGWWSVPVVPLLARTRGVRPQRGLAPARARGRRLHHGRDRRRVRSRAAAGGCRGGARGHAGADAPRTILCARATSWQTEHNGAPERGVTRCSFRSAVETWMSPSRSASTRPASWRASSAT